MSNPNDELHVVSHVARDLLQSAALFKVEKLVVWEYVSNSLQYVDPGVNPVVKVSLDSKRKRICVSDNGRGMDWNGLRNFFVMHGENIDRKEGKGGRGRFGTGKAAAFGIAESLRLSTVRKGKQSTVELHRRDIESMQSGDPIPVKTIEREVECSKSNGTQVEIDGIHLRSLDQAGIIRYIERHLAHWARNALVYVNNHECEFSEPPVAQERQFRPDEKLKKILGDVTLRIKVSMAPLDEDLRGVAIFSKDVWYETTLAGAEGREMTQYIFGDIDIPILDDDTSPIPAFDMTRAMKLNINNEIVRQLYAFIFENVEVVRRELVEVEKKRRAEEEMKKLAKQADEIAELLNEDFVDFSRRLAKAKAKAGSAGDAHTSTPSGQSGEDFVFGGVLSAETIAETGSIGASSEGTRAGGEKPREMNPQVKENGSEPIGKKTGGINGKGRKPKGGFSVEFDHLGKESYRAQYFPDQRIIYINLDHPQIAAARGNSLIIEISFRRLAYEVAFSEYSIALASEMAAHDEYIDPTDPIFDIRETLNRLARKAAILYQE